MANSDIPQKRSSLVEAYRRAQANLTDEQKVAEKAQADGAGIEVELEGPTHPTMPDLEVTQDGKHVTISGSYLDGYGVSLTPEEAYDLGDKLRRCADDCAEGN